MCVYIKARELPGVRLQALFIFIVETAYLIGLGLTREGEQGAFEI